MATNGGNQNRIFHMGELNFNNPRVIGYYGLVKGWLRNGGRDPMLLQTPVNERRILQKIAHKEKIDHRCYGYGTKRIIVLSKTPLTTPILSTTPQPTMVNDIRPECEVDRSWWVLDLDSLSVRHCNTAPLSVVEEQNRREGREESLQNPSKVVDHILPLALGIRRPQDQDWAAFETLYVSTKRETRLFRALIQVELRKEEQIRLRSGRQRLISLEEMRRKAAKKVFLHCQFNIGRVAYTFLYWQQQELTEQLRILQTEKEELSGSEKSGGGVTREF